MSNPSAPVIVVLGCRVRQGQPSSALLRRLKGARELSGQYPELRVILSGGRAWDGISESHAMRRWWASEGTHAPTFCENRSSSTGENAAFTAQLCREWGVTEVLLVTCDYHAPRAALLFSQQGLEVSNHEVQSPYNGWLRFRLDLREWAARCLASWKRPLP